MSVNDLNPGRSADIDFSYACRFLSQFHYYVKGLPCFLFFLFFIFFLSFFFLLFVNGNKQLSLLFICRPFLSGFADIPKFNGNICLVGWVLLCASIWGNGWLSTDGLPWWFLLKSAGSKFQFTCQNLPQSFCFLQGRKWRNKQSG